MKLTIYKIYCTPSDYENCDAIAFTKEQAEEYCKKANKKENEKSYLHKSTWFYTDEEEIDTNKVFEYL